ncbi:Peptidoglycan/xylan/chitin deacetylase, PgdA/CDA1 family [Amphibacillus marinus]|uniref:Peptidoglycan/xylan/chitin deacetylase, PgdA/CDA1 family n=1 Tax=Amphibacillus marinus TaxID=872970 RepID=A0A1H8L1W3_9BACI|nr:polysaccharide deacetylase family protein [Amphibacillus marinus]SEN98816.1 Peptidoglycan/xylan/chitin deacetylase, PgdA/CDA1 family [Amphibacillus marinus]
MKLILVAIIIFLSAGCADDNDASKTDTKEELTDHEKNTDQKQVSDHTYNEEQVEVEPIEESAPSYEQLKKTIVEKFENNTPTVWGENIDGVVTEIDTDDKVIALTFDACDSTPDTYDEDLIDFLIEEQIPATLFINARWIEEYKDDFTDLADNPLFEIANHGYDHKPLSVTGESAYGISGTENPAEVFDEVYKNQQLITEHTGKSPDYFRSGTAYYDNIAVKIVEFLGLTAVNYNVLGDAGGTFNKDQIVSTFESAQEGSIFLFHMNKPNSDISSGVIEGVQMLIDKGYDFVQLGEYDDHLK